MDRNHNEELLYRSCERGDVDKVREYLAKGDVDVNWENPTPLIVAVIEGHLQVVKMLLKNQNIDINKVNTNTPLHHAVFYGDTRIIRMILETQKIDAERPDRYGKKAYERVGQKNKEDVKQLLKQHKIRPLFLDKQNKQKKRRKRKANFFPNVKKSEVHPPVSKNNSTKVLVHSAKHIRNIQIRNINQKTSYTPPNLRSKFVVVPKISVTPSVSINNTQQNNNYLVNGEDSRNIEIIEEQKKKIENLEKLVEELTKKTKFLKNELEEKSLLVKVKNLTISKHEKKIEEMKNTMHQFIQSGEDELSKNDSNKDSSSSSSSSSFSSLNDDDDDDEDRENSKEELEIKKENKDIEIKEN